MSLYAVYGGSSSSDTEEGVDVMTSPNPVIDYFAHIRGTLPRFSTANTDRDAAIISKKQVDEILTSLETLEHIFHGQATESPLPSSLPPPEKYIDEMNRLKEENGILNEKIALLNAQNKVLRGALDSSPIIPRGPERIEKADRRHEPHEATPDAPSGSTPLAGSADICDTMGVHRSQYSRDGDLSLTADPSTLSMRSSSRSRKPATSPAGDVGVITLNGIKLMIQQLVYEYEAQKLEMTGVIVDLSTSVHSASSELSGFTSDLSLLLSASRSPGGLSSHVAPLRTSDTAFARLHSARSILRDASKEFKALPPPDFVSLALNNPRKAMDTLDTLSDKSVWRNSIDNLQVSQERSARSSSPALLQSVRSPSRRGSASSGKGTERPPSSPMRRSGSPGLRRQSPFTPSSSQAPSMNPSHLRSTSASRGRRPDVDIHERLNQISEERIARMKREEDARVRREAILSRATPK